MLTAARQTQPSPVATRLRLQLNNVPCDPPRRVSPALQQGTRKQALPRHAVVLQRWNTWSDAARTSANAALAVSRGETPTAFRAQQRARNPQ